MWFEFRTCFKKGLINTTDRYLYLNSFKEFRKFLSLTKDDAINNDIYNRHCIIQASTTALLKTLWASLKPL
jgi:hypothetical protein